MLAQRQTSVQDWLRWKGRALQRRHGVNWKHCRKEHHENKNLKSLPSAVQLMLDTILQPSSTGTLNGFVALLLSERSLSKKWERHSLLIITGKLRRLETYTKQHSYIFCSGQTGRWTLFYILWSCFLKWCKDLSWPHYLGRRYLGYV